MSVKLFKLSTIMLASAALSALVSNPVGAKPHGTAALCQQATAAQEAARRIPPQLLYAISLAESGRYVKSEKANIAWPWTVTAEGKGRFFSSKSAAIRAVRKLRRRGIKNIDVGCMQVNLKYHPKAFRSLEHAFDPQINAAYAAKFLTKLRRERHSWTAAVKHYHSATRSLHRPYQSKVYKIWRSERRKIQKNLVAERRLKRREFIARSKHARAQRLLADNRFSERRQQWLDRAAEALLSSKLR